MSLSPLVSFKSRFVTYLLNFPRIIFFGPQVQGKESLFPFPIFKHFHFCIRP